MGRCGYSIKKNIAVNVSLKQLQKAYYKLIKIHMQINKSDNHFMLKFYLDKKNIFFSFQFFFFQRIIESF